MRYAVLTLMIHLAPFAANTSDDATYPHNEHKLMFHYYNYFYTLFSRSVVLAGNFPKTSVHGLVVPQGKNSKNTSKLDHSSLKEHWKTLAILWKIVNPNLGCFEYSKVLAKN